MNDAQRIIMTPEMMARFCAEHLDKLEALEVAAAGMDHTESFLGHIKNAPSFESEREFALFMLRTARLVNSSKGALS